MASSVLAARTANHEWMGSYQTVSIAFRCALRNNRPIVNTAFDELVRLLVLLALTFAAAIFGSYWVWALTAALAYTLFVTVRENRRAI